MGMKTEEDIKEIMEEITEETQEIMEMIEKMVSRMDDDVQIVAVGYICMMIIAGFDNKPAMKETIKMIEKFIDKIDLKDDSIIY